MKKLINIAVLLFLTLGFIKAQDVVLTFYTPLFLDGLGAVYSSQRSITTDRSKLGR